MHGNHGARRKASFVCSSQDVALSTADVEANSPLNLLPMPLQQ